MKLISMVDFVLQVVNSDRPCDRGKMLDEIGNYAEFLKQPLKLEMFVPCNQEGNYWKFPPSIEEWEWAKKDSADAEQSYKQKEYLYQKAKEKVLFKGFEIHDIYVTHKFEFTMQLSDISGFIVEDVIDYDIELTENALKQIGL